jgi:hypothetical protein
MYPVPYLEFFGPKWHSLASLVPFQGPKKSRFSGPTPSSAPRNDVAPLKIITVKGGKSESVV